MNPTLSPKLEVSPKPDVSSKRENLLATPPVARRPSITRKPPEIRYTHAYNLRIAKLKNLPMPETEADKRKRRTLEETQKKIEEMKAQELAAKKESEKRALHNEILTEEAKLDKEIAELEEILDRITVVPKMADVDDLPFLKPPVEPDMITTGSSCDSYSIRSICSINGNKNRSRPTAMKFDRGIDMKHANTYEKTRLDAHLKTTYSMERMMGLTAFPGSTDSCAKGTLLRALCDNIYNVVRKKLSSIKIDYVVGIESVGFIHGPTLALMLNCGFLPIRYNHRLPDSKWADIAVVDFFVSSVNCSENMASEELASTDLASTISTRQSMSTSQSGSRKQRRQSISAPMKNGSHNMQIQHVTAMDDKDNSSYNAILYDDYIVNGNIMLAAHEVCTTIDIKVVGCVVAVDASSMEVKKKFGTDGVPPLWSAHEVRELKKNESTTKIYRLPR